MKWIFFSLLVSVFSTQAAQQYTESTCILLKAQVSDYKHRLGTHSDLYIREKTNFDTYCQNPISTKFRKVKTLSNQQVQKPQAKPFSKYSVPLKQEVAEKSKAEPVDKNLFKSLFTILLPMAVILCIGLVAIYYFRKKLPEIKGRVGERYVKNGLNKHLDDNKYHIINDVTLPLSDGGTTQIDHVVVSNFGIFVIETKNMTGWIFGHEKEAKWTQTIHRSKYYFQNPLRQNYKHTKTLAYLLNMGHEQIFSVVVFTPMAALKTKMPINVGYLDDMLGYIKSVTVEMFDNAMKQDILELIEEIKLTQRRKTNKMHINYLNEKHKNSFKSDSDKPLR